MCGPLTEASRLPSEEPEEPEDRHSQPLKARSREVIERWAFDGCSADLELLGAGISRSSGFEPVAPSYASIVALRGESLDSKPWLSHL